MDINNVPLSPNYNKYGIINFLEYRHLLLMSAQVMEMTEKEQSDFVYEVLGDIYKKYY